MYSFSLFCPPLFLPLPHHYLWISVISFTLAGSPPPHIYATPLDAIRLEGHRSKGAEALLAGGVPDFKLIVLILNADLGHIVSSSSDIYKT